MKLQSGFPIPCSNLNPKVSPTHASATQLKHRKLLVHLPCHSLINTCSPDSNSVQNMIVLNVPPPKPEQRQGRDLSRTLAQPP